MISLSTTALVAVPATHLVSRLASGIADAGRDFVSALQDSPQASEEDLNHESMPGADESRVLANGISNANSSKPSATNQPTRLADLLQSIQNLIANLSDDSDESVTIESLSGDQVQVTGDEPLASSVKQWTKLHPEWAQDWNTQAATTSASSKDPVLSKDPAPKKLTAKISSTSVKLEPT